MTTIHDAARKINRVLTDPAASDWIKNAINELAARDPVDAANDAETLAALMRDRSTAIAMAALTAGDLTP